MLGPGLDGVAYSSPMLLTRITWKVGIKKMFEGVRVAKANRVKVFKGST